MSLSSRWTSFGRGRAFVDQPVEQPIEMVLGLGAALGGEAGRLVDDDRGRILVDDEAADELDLVLGQRLALALRPGGGLLSPCGGTRMIWPASIRSPGVARLPSTRSCPVRAQRDTWPKLASGRLRLNQRSSRMPSSSARDGEAADVAHAVARIATRPAKSRATEPITDAAT